MWIPTFFVSIVISALLLLSSKSYAENIVSSSSQNLNTFQYLTGFSVRSTMEKGVDFFNPNFCPPAFRPCGYGTPAKDVEFDYERLMKIESNLQKVNRVQALSEIFKRVTRGKLSAHSQHTAILNFVNRSIYHNKFRQPTYKYNGQAVYDPLVLLELGEGRCGSAARLVADLMSAGGYKSRIVQVNNHVTAETFYGGSWHLSEANLFGYLPREFKDYIPSISELSQKRYILDAIDTTRQHSLSPGQTSNTVFYVYPSYHFFSKKAWEKSFPLTPLKYIKIATAEEAARSQWFGWNFYKTESIKFKISDFKAKYVPTRPEFNSVEFNSGKELTLGWTPSLDKDNDLIGYQLFVGSKSRGWNYGETLVKGSAITYNHLIYTKEMYRNVHKLPLSDVGIYKEQSTSISIDISNMKSPIFVSVQPLDQYGEKVGKTIYPISSELKITW